MRDYQLVRGTDRFKTYVYGVGTGLLWANSVVVHEMSGYRLLCIPEGLNLNADSFVRILEHQINMDVEWCA